MMNPRKTPYATNGQAIKHLTATIMLLLVSACANYFPPPSFPSPMSDAPYFVDSSGFMHETGAGQVVPPGGIPCPSMWIRDLPAGSACYAAALRERQEIVRENAQIETTAQSLLNKPVLLLYGAMLCGSPDDAISMRNRIAFGSCKASHGGWGVLTKHSGNTGSYFVKLDSGESGWMADADFETCQTYQLYRRFNPDPAPNTHCR